jgi:peptidoglycan/xylan/chitin deacetylase (PgdA/CDA1 family)
MRPATQVDTDGIWYSSVPVDGPYIAMTFDDGPHPTNTPRLLDMLRERNIKATFYVVGQNVRRYPEIMARMAAEGHEIGNHSWDHPSLTKLSAEGVDSQLRRTHEAIIQTTGVRPRTLRPPYGAFTRGLAARTFDDYGYKTIMWSVDPRDWADRSASIVTSRILDKTRSGSIVLAHDIHRSTIDAMPQTLDKLRAAGYQFVTVSQLINMENRGLAISTKPADPRPEAKADARSRDQGVAAAASTMPPTATLPPPTFLRN